MKEQIAENIEKLLRWHIVIAVIHAVLLVVFILVVVGVIKYKLLNAWWKNVLFIWFAVVITVGLPIVDYFNIAPIYRDYKEQAYIVVEDARVIIKQGASGGLDSTNQVILYDGENQIELKIETDISLDTEVEYSGKIAYLENSGYLIWYEFE